LIQKGLAIGIIILILASEVLPFALASYDRNKNNTDFVEKHGFDRYLYPEYYGSDGLSERTPYEQVTYKSHFDTSESKTIEFEKTQQPLDGPMDSPWPMYCFDSRHTGRSPYNTINTWDVVWSIKEDYHIYGSPVIDENGTIYVGSFDLYAINPNGTIKWMYENKNITGVIKAAPAIDENGIIYFGTDDGYFYALYPNGTLKWKRNGDNIYSSPAIGQDGTIYYTEAYSWELNAIYPNGTLKWSYTANHHIYSSPAIGQDGTIYFGSLDNYVYAINPNGTLKWKFNTGYWVHGSASIADDGTVYIGTDGYFYALNPSNGTEIWHRSLGPVWGAPVIDQEGNIYVGSWNCTFYSIYPNGTIRWTFHTPGIFWWETSGAISSDGTIYFGNTHEYWTTGSFFALYLDGTEKWRFSKGWYESSPVIGADGTVYISSCEDEDHGGNIYSKGYVYAFGIGELKANANGPYYGLINTPVQFEGSAGGGYRPYINWQWTFGDGETSEEQNPLHTYTESGNYSATLTVTDNSSNSSSNTTWVKVQASDDPPEKPIIKGRKLGIKGVTYEYSFTSIDNEYNPVWYYVDWGDGTSSDWLGPYNSDYKLTLEHSWIKKNKYTIRAKAKDIFNAESDWATLIITMPYEPQHFRFFEWLLEQFPHAFPILRYLVGH
jgi:outer membrane protein assembly factor BamB